MVMKMKSQPLAAVKKYQKIGPYLWTDIKVLNRMIEQLFPRKNLAGNYYLLMMKVGRQNFNHPSMNCYLCPILY